MILKHLKILLLAFTLTIVASIRVIPVKDPNNIIVAFGSCNKYDDDKESLIFDEISKLNPDLFVWLGDAAYIGSLLWPSYSDDSNDFIRSKFDKSKNDVHYQNLRRTAPIVGVWDDHDYGSNNGDKNHPFKDQYQTLYLDFLDEPVNSSRRLQKGLYESYYIGSQKKVKLILFDTRYFRDPRNWLGMGSHENKDVLGEEQWKWFEEELRNNEATFTILGSSTQFLPDDRYVPETWYPKSRERVLSLLKEYRVNGTIILSGDVHFAEILKLPCWRERFGYPLYEFTSSGLTHNNGQLDAYCYTYNEEPVRYFGINFGVIKIDLENEELQVEIKDKNGMTVMEKSLSHENLMFHHNQKVVTNNLCVLDTPPLIRALEALYNKVLNGEMDTFIFLGVIGCFACILMGGFIVLCLLGRKVLKYGIKMTSLNKIKLV